ncbi:SIMPL domain-containing protein [Halomicroarcula sp. GCM10025709]|uniref:SIMPL domain-containing protein n=1 Tax=Haloarcula TaxID=2237 RepID=UPI0024C27CF4|nr:SIMPL domain-containing protein [Halomicroarcula sp. YJ-61-S]
MDAKLLAVGGAVVLLAVGAVGLTVGDTQTASPDNATVSVSATAEVERTPDRAVVTVAAVGRGDTAEAARNALSGDAQSIQEALRDEGATVTSSQFRIEPEYERTETGREQVGYIAVHTIEAETGDVNTTGTLVDAAVDAGADRIEGIRYELNEQTRQDAREDALRTAMDRARADADTVADAAGRSVGEVATIQTSQRNDYVVYAEAATADAGGRTTIEPTTITVDASVQVTYGLD